MNRPHRSLAPVAALALAALPAHAQLLGVANFAPFSTQSLYTINPATGAASLIGSTGLSQIIDIAFNPADNTLYALTAAADLYTLNPATGAASLRASVPGLTPEGGLTFSGGSLLLSSADSLFSVNLSTGAATLIGPHNSADNDVSALALVNSSLIAYAKNGSLNDSLLAINPTTGAASPFATLPFDSASSVGGLAFTGSDLFLSDGSSLFSINTTTGAPTLLGSHSVPNLSGLAFIPSPSSLLILAVGPALVARRRR